jgi:hypothetical protein
VACRGWYTALQLDEAKALLASPDVDQRIDLLNSLYYTSEADHRILLVDKSWDAMHRVLCDGWLDAVHGDIAMRGCVVGGTQLSKRSDWIISFVACDLVKRVADAIEPITESWFRERYFQLARIPRGIFAHRYEGYITEEDFGYTWAYFDDVRRFYRTAANRDLAMVFAADQ